MRVLFLLLIPSMCFAQDEVSYIHRVARNPASELRFLQRRTANTNILNSQWGKGWAQTPTFGGVPFDPVAQRAHPGLPPAPTNRLRLGFSWRMEHWREGTDPNSRVGLSYYPGNK